MAQKFTFGAGAAPGRLREVFEEFGIVIVKGLLSADRLAAQRSEISRLIAIRLQALGVEAEADEDMDVLLAGLLRIDRRHAMDIIRAIKDAPFFYGILADEALNALSKACLGCTTLLSIHDIAQFRIDPPHDDVRNFDWHQDFQYNVMSLDAVTIWYPLTRITEDMGPLSVVPGSHRTITPVEVNFEGHKSGSGTMHSVMHFQVDVQEAEEKAVRLCPVEEGDVVAFHSLLLHRSNANRSNRARWTANPRFGNASDPSFAKRGWLAVRDRTQSAFAEYYPDYVKATRP
ncbi:MAG: phytanoyl-CoA dioxygenase family protein [Pseudomonadota bacterium]